MHIGYVTPESPFDSDRGGGIAAYLRAIIPALLARGHRISVFTGDSSQGTERRGRLTIHHVRLPNLHWYLFRLLPAARTAVLPLRQVEWSAKFYRAVAASTRRDPLDVLECSEVGGLFLHRLVPLVVRLHGSEYVFRRHTGQPITLGVRLNHRLEKRIWRQAAALTAPSRYQARLAAQELGWPTRQIHAIPNPLAKEILEAATQMQEMACEVRQNRRPIVLYTGRLAPVKGTEVLLDAARIVLREMPDVRFVLAGPWQMPGKPADWGLIRDNGEERDRAIRWLGHVPWSQLIDWYRRAALFVMPSYFESFGLSVAEAMAFGLPVVATRAGALPELVEDGVTGILTPPSDSQALIEAIVRLLQRPALRQRIGQRGRARVLEGFAPEQVAGQMLLTYQEATEKGNEDS